MLYPSTSSLNNEKSIDSRLLGPPGGVAFGSDNVIDLENYWRGVWEFAGIDGLAEGTKSWHQCYLVFFRSMNGNDFVVWRNLVEWCSGMNSNLNWLNLSLDKISVWGYQLWLCFPVVTSLAQLREVFVIFYNHLITYWYSWIMRSTLDKVIIESALRSMTLQEFPQLPITLTLHLRGYAGIALSSDHW